MSADAPSTVYMVTEGSYSDYTVMGLFSTRESAEGYMEAVREKDRYSAPIIEEMLLDAPPTEWWQTEVRMTPEGKVLRVSTQMAPPGPVPPLRWLERHLELWISVRTKDHDRAVKVANERRLQWLAEVGAEEAQG